MNISNSNSQQYHIRPMPVKKISLADIHLSDKKASYDLMLLFFLWAVVCVILLRFLHVANVEAMPGWGWCLPFIGGFLVSYSVVDALWEARANKLVYEKNKIAPENSKREAENTTKKVWQYYQEAQQCIKKARSAIEVTILSVEQVKQRYERNSYAQFWDNVEQSLIELSVCEDVIKEFNSHCQEYYNALKNRRHNFPELVDLKNILPNMNEIHDELYNLIIKGKSNNQFSVAYDQRVEKEAVIKNVKYLSDVTNSNNVEETLQCSFNDLRHPVSFNYALTMENRVGLG